MLYNNRGKVVVLISDRQEKLLKLIVEEYIKDVRPVGSKALCEVMNCSSATIKG